MGKVIASYLVRVTLREPDEWPESADPGTIEAPTNEHIENLIGVGIKDQLPAGVIASVGSERTDK